MERERYRGQSSSLTFQRIEQAINCLKAKKDEVTIHSIQQSIGTGGKKMIAMYFRLWQALQAAELPVNAVQLIEQAELDPPPRQQAIEKRLGFKFDSAKRPSALLERSVEAERQGSEHSALKPQNVQARPQATSSSPFESQSCATGFSESMYKRYKLYSSEKSIIEAFIERSQHRAACVEQKRKNVQALENSIAQQRADLIRLKEECQAIHDSSSADEKQTMKALDEIKVLACTKDSKDVSPLEPSLLSSPSTADKSSALLTNQPPATPYPSSHSNASNCFTFDLSRKASDRAYSSAIDDCLSPMAALSAHHR